ncbi:hypothetical protein [Bacillus sp. T33-2]|uniref:hypothetical protein n=1 Tax=Bacillus sp. T33-2 TaxID=2054168 RepID=UPI000C772445|nr:hypothetical protein [Bacillus sp. T33-2]PLR99577.1 hypothetical protein CVD19_00505 [Bacillus sp. T33-2]
MYAIIKNQGSHFELQYKHDINSRVVSYAERASNPEWLKVSLTADWMECEKENVLWYAKIG